MKRYASAVLALMFYASILPWSAGAAGKAKFDALTVDRSMADVRTYGAVSGDTSSSAKSANTAAFRAAIATGTPVYVPSGYWYIDNTLALSGSRNQMIGTDNSFIIRQSGDWNVVELSGARTSLRQITILSQGGDGYLLKITGSYANVRDVYISGSGTAGVFSDNEVGIGFSGSYLTFANVNVWNCGAFGVYDIDGGSGTVHFVDSHVFLNNVGVDIAGPQFDFVGGTVAHNVTNEIRAGTRLATASALNTFFRGSPKFVGTHIESDNDKTEPMIVVGDNTSASAASDMSGFSLVNGFLALNESDRVPILYGSGDGVTLINTDVLGAKSGLAGIIQANGANAESIYTIGVRHKSGSTTVPIIKPYAFGKWDLQIKEGGIYGTKPIIVGTATTDDTFSYIRFQTYKADGTTLADRLKIQAAKDKASVIITDNTYLMLGAHTGLATCDPTLRQRIVVINGGAGVADNVVVCIKNAADAYEWKPLY